MKTQQHIPRKHSFYNSISSRVCCRRREDVTRRCKQHSTPEANNTKTYIHKHIYKHTLLYTFYFQPDHATDDDNITTSTREKSVLTFMRLYVIIQFHPDLSKALKFTLETTLHRQEDCIQELKQKFQCNQQYFRELGEFGRGNGLRKIIISLDQLLEVDKDRVNKLVYLCGC